MKTDKQIMDELFPNATIYPNNSLTPSITYMEDDSPQLAFLIKAEYEMIFDFIHEQGDGKVLAESTLYMEETDLVIRLEFHYDNPAGNPIFEAVIYGDQPDAQIEMCKALKQISRYHIFIANSDLEIIKFKVFNWDAEAHSPLLDQILNRGGVTH